MEKMMVILFGPFSLVLVAAASVVWEQAWLGLGCEESEQVLAGGL